MVSEKNKEQNIDFDKHTEDGKTSEKNSKTQQSDKNSVSTNENESLVRKIINFKILKSYLLFMVLSTIIDRGR